MSVNDPKVEALISQILVNTPKTSMVFQAHVKTNKRKYVNMEADYWQEQYTINERSEEELAQEQEREESDQNGLLPSDLLDDKSLQELENAETLSSQNFEVEDLEEL
jgi:hypothetical protein